MVPLTLFAYAVSAAAYVWPSPKLDALEGMRWDQDDIFNGLASFIQPCDFYVLQPDEFPTGRANVPDWIRTAYHDMATHNVQDGTGGLDASIRFAEEQARGENVGNGFSNTLDAFIGTASRYISIADLIAIGTITAIEQCGGPVIPFRGGRVDAGEPNTPGVPEPQQDLESHIASFAKQGFTQTEMIGLVACGHSFGGVEHGAFPDSVPDLHDPNNTLSVAHFDSTFVTFDNNVATEYIDGTTQNPLVVGANDTTNSDKRIFASDGNATMLAFAKSADLFASTCATLIARMLDTVPSGVELTDVIDPLPVKPTQVALVLDGDMLKLSGLVRLWGVPLDPNRVVGMMWDDRAGATYNSTLVDDHESTSMGGRITSAWYAFNSSSTGPPAVLVNATTGIKSLRFTVDGKMEDQGGVGFAVQDDVVFSASSCLTKTGFPSKARFDVAVRNGLNPTRVFLEQDVRDSADRVSVQETDIAPPTQPVSARAGAYSLWSIEATSDEPYTIGWEVDGAKFSTTDEHSLFELDACVKPARRNVRYIRNAGQ